MIFFLKRYLVLTPQVVDLTKLACLRLAFIRHSKQRLAEKSYKGQNKVVIAFLFCLMHQRTFLKNKYCISLS